MLRFAVITYHAAVINEWLDFVSNVFKSTIQATSGPITYFEPECALRILREVLCAFAFKILIRTIICIGDYYAKVIRGITRRHLISLAWWRHQMETFSALLAICAGNSPVPGEFPAQKPVTRRFDVFFILRLNKRLSKQSWGWSFDMLSRPLWRHRNRK